MIRTLLRTGKIGRGVSLGSARQPTRYRLLEELSPQKRRASGSERDGPCVWKAADTHSRNLVAIKFDGSTMSNFAEGLDQEALSLWRVAGHSTLPSEPVALVPSSHSSQSHCISIRDSFYLPDEHDPHLSDAPELCNVSMVLELLGPSVAEWQRTRSTPYFPLSTVRSLVKQVLLALDYLHTGLGEGQVWYGERSGDGLAHNCLVLDNLLLRDHYSSDDLRSDKPTTDSPFIKLVGFSTSTWASASSSLYPGHLDASSPSQALEADDYGPALAHDIFNVGTITSRLLFDRNLALDGTGGGAKMEHTLAALFPGEEWPEQLVYGYGVDREPWTNLDSDGKCLPTLRQRIEATGKVTDPKEAEQLHSFLKACWTLNSYKRPSAKEVLKHVWLREEQKP